jgi:arylsulfatase A-like enzyme
LFFEVNYHAAYEPLRAVRTQRWKYIRRFDGREKPVLANVDNGESKVLWLKQGWPERPVPQEVLYDLCFDPNEMQNHVAGPEYQAVVQDLRQRLQRWMEETRDPLLTGPVSAPAGAIVNDPDAVSPRQR